MSAPIKTIHQCMQVLSAVTTCSQAPVTNSKFDVVSELTRSLLAKLKEIDAEWASEIAGEETGCLPSTSDAPQGTVVDDPRIRLGRVLSLIYRQLARSLKARKSVRGEDEYTFLSVQEQALLVASLQFYVAAQLLAYLDEGVGIPISKRSQFIKSWSRIDQDLEFRRVQIRQFLSVAQSLMEANEAVKGEVLKSFIADLIPAHEQLISLGMDRLPWVEEALADVPKTLLVVILLSLSKRTNTTPQWFTTAVGGRLSTILRSEDGLFHTLAAYIEMGGVQFWEDSPLLSCLARQLALPPRNVKQIAYYEQLHRQFLHLLKKGCYPSKGLIQLYSFFIDAMAGRSPLAGEVLVLDRMLKPFEILLESSPQCAPWTAALADSMGMLNLLADEKICPKLLTSSQRLFELIPLLLSLLSSDCFDEAVAPGRVKSVSEQIVSVLRFFATRVDNLSHLLLSVVVSRTGPCYQLKYKRALVSVVGEESEEAMSLESIDCEDREVLLMRKLDAVLKFVKSLDSSSGSCLLIQILYESANMWTLTVEAADGPRFTSPDGSSNESEWLRPASHLVALFCFEHLGEWDVDPSSPQVLAPISKLITTILTKSVEWLESDKDDASFFDVRSSSPSEDSRLRDVQQTSTKMAVGLAAAVVAAGTIEASADCLQPVAASLEKFIAAAGSSHREGELSTVVKDAREVLQLFELIGMKVDVQEQAIKVVNRTRPAVDFLAQLRSDLDDEMVPVRGGALLRVSRAIRRKDPRVLDALEPWLAAKVRDLVADADSYVFLSAINALAEIACYSPSRHLGELLQLFLDAGRGVQPDDGSMVILRGKLAEVIGKVFRVLGDISPAWLNRAANIFLNSLREDNDIIRASSLSAFSDLVASCRGRGLQKVLDELFYAVESLLRTEQSDLVRRAAVHLIRQCLRSCERDLLHVLGDRLRDLRRELVRLWKWDRDHVVRLHAELCLEEIAAGLQSAIECETSPHLRVIKLK